MASAIEREVPLHQVENGFDCASQQRPCRQRKSMLRRCATTLVIGSAAGIICFFVMDSRAATHAPANVVSFDLDCIKNHLSVHDGGINMVTDCEVNDKGGGKALAKFTATPALNRLGSQSTATAQHFRTQPSVMVEKNQVSNWVSKLPQAATAAAIAAHAEVAHAKSVIGVNGALDFGPLAGDQPGGEGTGKALGINDDSLGFVLLGVTIIIGYLWAQWQSYQEDDEDFFDTYDSRRSDREFTNRNRV